MALFGEWAKVTGFRLQISKCEVVPLVDGRLHEFVRTLVEMVGSAADTRACPASRCLGVVFGPGAGLT